MNLIDTENTLFSLREYLNAFSKEETTITNYIQNVRRFLKHCNKQNIEPFTREGVQSWLAELRQKSVSGTTLRNKFYLLKTFFYAFDREFQFRKGEAPRPTQAYRPLFTQEEMYSLEKVAREKTQQNLRNYALIRMENCIGLRQIELRNADISDLVLDVDQPYIIVDTRKHGEEVRRELDPETVNALKIYLSTRERTQKKQIEIHGKYYGGEALFIRGNGRRGGSRLSLSGLSYIMKILGRKLESIKSEQVTMPPDEAE
jgi:site-specific recombinase XerD